MPDGDPRPDTPAQEAVEFLKLVADAESTNRANALDDLKFRYGEQWEAGSEQARLMAERPALTINETDAFCRQIVNAIKEQRPRGKAHPTDNFATKKIAEIVTGLCRHVVVNSNGDIAFDHAVDMAVTSGVGYWRLRSDYVREDSFDQEIFLDSIFNQFSVYFDPNSMLLDGSDAEKCLITDEMTRAMFRKQFKGAKEMPFENRASGDITNDWCTKDNIRLAEFYQIERVPAELVRLVDQNGNKMDEYGDEIPPPALREQMGLTIAGTRNSYKRIVRWQKQSGVEVLDSKVVPGRWIPVIPCYGVRALLDGKMQKFGAVRFGRDPQLLVNFWTTAVTECIAQSPKAKWLMVAGQDDGFEQEFATANTSARAALHYNAFDVEGKPAPPPQRIQPEGAPQGMMASLALANQSLQKVMGLFDPEVRNPNFPKSGRAIKAERNQSEQSNYHFYDNLTVSMCHTYRVMFNMMQKVYDVQVVKRIIGDDGKPKLVTLNQKVPNEQDAAIAKVLNDVTTGEYDFVMEVGPGYNTKREEGLDAMLEILPTPLGEIVAQTAGDLVVRMMDAPGADMIADRMQAANPLAQTDEESDVPPAAQMQIKALQGKLEEAGKVIQGLEIEKKSRIDVEKVKQDGATKRTLMQETGAAHTEQIRQEGTLAVENAENLAWMHDVAVKAQTSLSVAEINALAKLLTTNSQIEASDRAGERQIAAKADEAREKTET